jgi:hypothetical protein
MQHICHHNVTSDSLDVERHEIAGQALINESLIVALVIFPLNKEGVSLLDKKPGGAVYSLDCDDSAA